MSIPPNFLDVLMILYPRLKDAAFPWAFTGSVGMVLQGMDLPIHDIDLQTDAPGAPSIQAAFPEYVTHPVEMRHSERIRSWFGEMEINGIKVEIMGDMVHREPGKEWQPSLDLPALIRHVEYQGMRLPVMDLAHEVDAYQRMNRLEKAEKIRAFLENRE